MPSVVFVFPDGRRRTVEVRAGSSVLEAARSGEVAIEGACGGLMACATCHVHVDDAWFDRLQAPSAEEEEMLELAQDLDATSRLGCQIRVSPALDGLILHLPASTLLDD